MLRIGFSDKEKTEECTRKLAKADMLPAMNIRENSIYAYAGEDRKVFENVTKWLLENDVCFEAIEIAQPSLEDVFLKLTGAERG